MSKWASCYKVMVCTCKHTWPLLLHAVEKLTEHINVMHSAFAAVPVRYAVHSNKVSCHIEHDITILMSHFKFDCKVSAMTCYAGKSTPHLLRCPCGMRFRAMR
jgi:hypothetical protein